MKNRALPCSRAARTRLAVLATCLAVTCAAPAARAGIASPWLSLGALTGATRFDAHLADYQWKVDPRAGWGAQAIAGVGPVGAGVRVWQARTSQHIEFADTPNPAVHITSFDLVGRAQLLSRWGVGLEACASAGRMHLGYSPDHVAVTTSGSGSIDVALQPVDTWVTGGGLALRRGLAGPWGAAVEVDTQVFRLDTAHRSGSTIVTGRERFSEWSARFELARSYGKR